MHSLRLMWTPWAATTGLLLVLIVAALAVANWRRSGFARATGWLESLRVLVVLLIAITLNQPEWLETYLPDERPTVVLLVDESASMQTADVFSNQASGEAPARRCDWIRPWLEPAAWEKVQDRMEVVRQSFSSTSGRPDEGTDLHTALEHAVRNHAHLRGVVLLSDGDWNMGLPPVQAVGRLRAAGAPVFAVAVGSAQRLPDVELLRVDAPTFGVVHKPLRIPFVVDSALPREQVATVTLQPSTGPAVQRQITIPPMRQQSDWIQWTPTEVGEFELTVRLPEFEGERIAENNELTVPISVRKEMLQVLLIESVPRWEYRYLRNALERDPGVEVSCLLFQPGLSKSGGGRGYLSSFPPSRDELSRFDVIFLGDVAIDDKELSLEQCQLIRGMVESQACGLILMPGMRGGHLSLMASPLAELYPVVLDAAQPRGWGSRTPAQMELTEAGRRSLLTRLEDLESDNARLWESLPGFQWYAAALRAKAGTEVLATHRSASGEVGRVPLLVTKTLGTGKILFMGTDGAWRWREGVEDKYHYRFWGQVARWMAYQRGMAQGEHMRMFFTPDRPREQDQIVVHANVMSRSGEPLQQGTVSVRITAPSGKSNLLQLESGDGEWGLFTGSFSPSEAGLYELELSCRENGSTLSAQVNVQAVTRERVGRPTRQDVLEELAVLTGGRLIATDAIASLAEQIAELPEPPPQVRRLRIWCHPAWAGLIAALLGLFWVGRKMVGSV